jgi:hypothetical protein
MSEVSRSAIYGVRDVSCEMQCRHARQHYPGLHGCTACVVRGYASASAAQMSEGHFSIHQRVGGLKLLYGANHACASRTDSIVIALFVVRKCGDDSHGSECNGSECNNGKIDKTEFMRFVYNALFRERYALVNGLYIVHNERLFISSVMECVRKPVNGVSFELTPLVFMQNASVPSLLGKRSIPDDSPACTDSVATPHTTSHFGMGVYCEDHRVVALMPNSAFTKMQQTIFNDNMHALLEFERVYPDVYPKSDHPIRKFLHRMHSGECDMSLLRLVELSKSRIWRRLFLNHVTFCVTFVLGDRVIDVLDPLGSLGLM